MLSFSDEEVLPIAAADKVPCSVCADRASPWKAKRKGEVALVPMCGWCVMYAESQWGFDHRAELLHVGRTCAGLAAQHGRPVPELDERGRLGPFESERYMMGIAFTSRMFGQALANATEVGRERP